MIIRANTQKPLSWRVASGVVIAVFLCSQTAGQLAFAFFQAEPPIFRPANSNNLSSETPTPASPVWERQDVTRNGMSLRFIYSAHEMTVTAVDLDTLKFSVYRYAAGHVGRLLMLGTAETLEDDHLTPKEVIEFSEIKRNGKTIPVYIFRKADEPGYLIRERLDEGEDGLGIIGRVLRYKGDEGDFEYFYDDGSQSDHASITVLNYTKGEFLKFGIAKETVRKQEPEKMSRSEAGKDFGYLISGVRTDAKAMFVSCRDKYFRFNANAKPKTAHAAAIEGMKWNWEERGPPALEKDILIFILSRDFYFDSAFSLHSFQIASMAFPLLSFADSFKISSQAGTVRRAVAPAGRNRGPAL